MQNDNLNKRKKLQTQNGTKRILQSITSRPEQTGNK